MKGAFLDPEKVLNGASLFIAALFICMPLSWRRLVKIALVLVIFEGAVRKWLLPSLSQFVYFGKDFILVIAYMKYFASREPKYDRVALDSLLLFLIVANSLFIMVQACNFSLGSPIVGLIGVRNYLVFLPLIFIVKELFRSQEELANYIKMYLVLVIPVVALAILQHFSPADSPLNMYVSEEDAAKALVGTRVRTTGTFSYIAGFASYLQTMAALAIPMLVLQLDRSWHNILRGILVAIVTGIIFSGSRTPVLSVILFVLAYFVCNKVLRKMGLYKKFIIPGLVMAMVLLQFLAGSLESLIQRFSNDQHLGMRVLASITTPFDYILHSGFWGYGAGATYQAVGRIREMFGLPSGEQIPVFFESEPERIMLELGPLGFMLWYALRIRLMIVLWRCYSSLSFPLLRELALSCFLVHSISFLGQMVFQVTFSVYYWFLAGFALLLPSIEQRELAEENVLDSTSSFEFGDESLTGVNDESYR